MNIDFTKCEIGTKVESFRYGKGEIVKISADGTFPVDVKFNNFTGNFTKGGKCLSGEVRPDLYFQIGNIPAEWFTPPRPDLKVDDTVMVRDATHVHWLKRHFAKWGDNGEVLCWGGGCTKWTSYGHFASWKHYRLPTDEELKG